jgi:gluconate 2-dehydrogenase alpha chain
MHTFGRAPSWGSEWKRFVMDNADRTVMALIQKTTLPYEDNVVDLDPTITDPLGRPVCRITADFKANERRIASFTQDKAEAWFKSAGAVATHRLPIGTMGPTTHAYGGTRMGNDPETSVVDRWGFCHEVPNLAVLGSSVMGTSGSKNPTQTAQALAWRTADHLVKQWTLRS